MTTTDLEIGSARVGAGRAFVRAWPVFVPVIIGEALVQALLVVTNPTATFSWGFSLLVLGSVVALLIGVWLTTGAAVAAVDGGSRSEIIRASTRRPIVALWALAIGVVAIGVALGLLWLAPLVLLIGSLVLPSVVRDGRPKLRLIKPVRAVLYLIAAAVLVIVSWVVALVLGLFLTGVLGAGITWLWFGLVASFVLCLFSSLDRN